MLDDVESMNLLFGKITIKNLGSEILKVGEKTSKGHAFYIVVFPEVLLNTATKACINMYSYKRTIHSTFLFMWLFILNLIYNIGRSANIFIITERNVI